MKIIDIIKIAINSSENLSKEKRNECIEYINNLHNKINKATKLLEKHNCENCCDYNNMYALAELKDMKFDKENFELINK